MKNLSKLEIVIHPFIGDHMNVKKGQVRRANVALVFVSLFTS